jgi:hypothetical protein
MHSEDRAEPLGDARKISIKDQDPLIMTRNKRQQGGPVSDGASALASKSSTYYSNMRFLVSIARILNV